MVGTLTTTFSVLAELCECLAHFSWRATHVACQGSDPRFQVQTAAQRPHSSLKPYVLIHTRPQMVAVVVIAISGVYHQRIESQTQVVAPGRIYFYLLNLVLILVPNLGTAVPRYIRYPGTYGTRVQWRSHAKYLVPGYWVERNSKKNSDGRIFFRYLLWVLRRGHRPGSSGED
eukprot:SAG11_NODE_1000_length_6221_cov_10.092943_5_plen_173_part_00